MPYFGIWADETAARYGRRDALAILADAVRSCYDEDARTAEVTAALDYLSKHATRPAAFRDFRKALDIIDPAERERRARLALDAIIRVLGA